MARNRQNEIDQRLKALARAGLDLGQLDDVLGFHIRMASAAIYRDFSASMAELDLTQKQVAVLELIANNANVSQIDLAAALGTDRATMMALIDRLESRGVVERRPSQTDKRRQILSLSIEGAAILTSARVAVATHERRFTSRYDAGELEALVAGLKRLYRES
jgi:DNA-binding MarR family transcriptional regulator